MTNDFPLTLSSRADYAALVRRLTEPTRPFFSASGARLLNLTNGAHYTRVAQENEGCMRILWGLFPLWGGDRRETFFRDVYRNTFRAGTDPANPEYWGENVVDRDQRFVEYATIGCGLLLAPAAILGGLTDAERENVFRYVDLINHRELCDNNWLFFRVLANCGLRKNGFLYDAARVEADFAAIERDYLGDGWYSDGEGSTQRDYYVAFAFHFYSLLYAKTMGAENPERAARFRARARRFAEDFIYFFDKSGASVSFGRSQTYRFAQVAFFSALVFAEEEALPWGVIKGIINRNLRYFLSLPIFDTAGLLSVGYGYPDLVMSEHYNGSGAPYWAFKAFLLLAAPEDHPYFAARELPYPSLPKTRPLTHFGALAQKTATDTVLLGVGQCGGNWLPHGAEKYAKFAYSARFGFSTPRGDSALPLAAPDSMLAFEYMDTFFVRRRNLSFTVTDHDVTSVWSPFPGVTVRTVLTPVGDGHLRRHEITSEGITCRAYDCGFSVPRDDENQNETALATETVSQVTTPRARETVECREGRGTPGCVITTTNTNVVAPRTYLPYILYEIKPGTTVVETFVTAAWAED